MAAYLFHEGALQIVLPKATNGKTGVATNYVIGIGRSVSRGQRLKLYAHRQIKPTRASEQVSRDVYFTFPHNHSRARACQLPCLSEDKINNAVFILSRCSRLCSCRRLIFRNHRSNRQVIITIH